MRWTLWGAIGFGLLAACSDERDAYEDGRSDLCAGLCAGYVRCGLADDGCAAGCAHDYHPRGIRGSGLSALGACARSAHCKDLASDEPLASCFDQVAAAEPLRDEVLAYCESAALNDFRCNVWWSVEECSHTMGLWEDAVLERARACHDEGCSELATCEKAVFDSP